MELGPESEPAPKREVVRSPIGMLDRHLTDVIGHNLKQSNPYHTRRDIARLFATSQQFRALDLKHRPLSHTALAMMDARRQIGETKAKARKIFADTAKKATRGEYVTPPELVPGVMSEQEQRNLRMIRQARRQLARRRQQ